MGCKGMDLSGQIFGKLTAVSRVESGGRGSGGMWICRCKCGNTRILSASELQHGRVKSCGLCSRAEDLTGRRYGRLLVLEQAEPLLSFCRKRPQWLCLCDCGKTVVVLASNLKAGATISCGCYSKEVRDSHSRQTTKYCIICGKPFTEIPSRAKHKVTCSPECQAQRIRAIRRGCTPSKEARAKMSESHRNKNIYKHLDEIRGDSTEALLKDPRYGRFETNIHSIRWHLISPEGEEFQFRNLNHWLRTDGSRYFGLDEDDSRFNTVKSCLQHAKWKTKKTGRQYHYMGWAVIPVEDGVINKSDLSLPAEGQKEIPMIKWIITDRNDADFTALCRKLNEELVLKLSGSVDPVSSRANATDDFESVILGKAGNVPVACAALRPFSEDTAEIKRMFVSPEWRRKGLGKTILEKCEEIARQEKYRCMVLETNTLLPDARSLYEKNGYVKIESYGPYAYLKETLCMGKTL